MKKIICISDRKMLPYELEDLKRIYGDDVSITYAQICEKALNDIASKKTDCDLIAFILPQNKTVAVILFFDLNFTCIAPHYIKISEGNYDTKEPKYEFMGWKKISGITVETALDPL